MITHYYHNNREFQLVEHNRLIENENVFTILVGKNGTGKSTLLGSLVRDAIGDTQNSRFFRDYEIGFRNYQRGKIQHGAILEQIIAVSSSPFDKFPVPRKIEGIPGYTYLGLRDLYGLNFGLAYLSKIIASLVASVYQRPSQIFEIAKVLNYLGYSDTIRVRFSLASSRRMLEELLSFDKPEEIFDYNRFRHSRNFNRRFFFAENDAFDYSKFHYLQEIIRRILGVNFIQRFQLILNNEGIHLDHGFDVINEDLLFLIQSGLVRLKDVGLERTGGGIFSIMDASSGEQSVILSILGIASQISDNSLICIDEPEVCLHPQWQERYIQILISTFRTYKNCHFVIATHSPQIISRLERYNCYILSMESGDVKNAESFIGNSVDYQLANVFNSPGYKNEYLSRIALNIFTKVSKRKSFDDDDLEKFRFLQQQSYNLEQADPVYNLYLAIKEMHAIYA